MATPLAATGQSQDSNICITGTPSLLGTRTVTLDHSDTSSLTITVTFQEDKVNGKKSPYDISESDTDISSPQKTQVDDITEAVAEKVTKEKVSEFEKGISSPREKLVDDTNKVNTVYAWEQAARKRLAESHLEKECSSSKGRGQK